MNEIPQMPTQVPEIVEYSPPPPIKKSELNKKILIIVGSLALILVSVSVFAFIKLQTQSTTPHTTISETDTETDNTTSPSKHLEVPVTEVSSLGVSFKAPSDWQVIKMDESGAYWQIQKNGKQVASVTLKPKKVLSFSSEQNQKQEIDSVVGSIEGTKATEVNGSGETSSFTFQKETDENTNEYSVQLDIPDQASMDVETKSELHEDFDKLLNTLEFTNEKAKQDQMIASVSADKTQIEANGIDKARITISLTDRLKKKLPKIYITLRPKGATDFTENKITSLRALPESKTDLAATVIGEYVLTVAGKYYNNTLQSAHLYNFALDQWEKMPDLSHKTSLLTLNTIGNSAYAVGGNTDLTESNATPYGIWNTMEVFDLQTKKWSQGPNLLGYRSTHTAGVAQNALYLFGGLSAGTKCSGGNFGGPVEKFDPTSNSWTQISDQGICTVGAQSASVGNKVYYFGGMRDGQLLSQMSDADRNNVRKRDAVLYSLETWIYDSSDNSLKKGSEMPRGRMRGQAVAIGRYIYLIGGMKPVEKDDFDWRNEHVDIYDTQTDTWRTLGSIYPTPIDFAAVSYKEKIYSFGGDHLYFWPASNAVFSVTPLTTLIDPVQNPSNSNGVVTFDLKSITTGTRSYDAIVKLTNGREYNAGSVELTFK